MSGAGPNNAAEGVGARSSDRADSCVPDRDWVFTQCGGTQDSLPPDRLTPRTRREDSLQTGHQLGLHCIWRERRSREENYSLNFVLLQKQNGVYRTHRPVLQPSDYISLLLGENVSSPNG